MKRNVLIISLTNFYGGGESFIISHLQNIHGISFYYLVLSSHLYERLETDKKKLITQANLFFLAREVKKLVLEWKIDVVVLNGGRSFFLAPFFYNRFRCVGVRHTLNDYVKKKYKYFYIILLNLSYFFMNRIVHVSNKSKKEQIFFKRKACVIYNGVLPKNFLQKKKHFSRINFLFVGRMTKEKGVDILINVFNEISQINDSVHLYLVGKGEIDNSYFHTANIHFEGFSETLDSYYQNADWYITLPSRENCSIAILDALSYGLPVITTNVGGNTELIQDNYNGFIVERCFSTVINFLYTKVLTISNVYYQTLSENALNSFMCKFNLENQKKAYKELLEDL